jgi:hypothetical protein
LRLAGSHIRPVGMFLGTFAWSSVDVSRPFLAAIGLACLPLATIGYQEVVG